jgi:hypothetical protein
LEAGKRGSAVRARKAEAATAAEFESQDARMSADGRGRSESEKSPAVNASQREAGETEESDSREGRKCIGAVLFVVVLVRRS